MKRRPPNGTAVADAPENLPGPSELQIMMRPGPLIRRVHQKSVAVFLHYAREFDLTPVQYGSLQVVAMFPGIHQAALGKLLALDRQTISNVVQRLCQKRLLDRLERDARTSALYTTGAATALISAMQSRLRVVDDLILEPLSQEEKGVFLQMLTKLVAGNDESGETARAETAERPRPAGALKGNRNLKPKHVARKGSV